MPNLIGIVLKHPRLIMSIKYVTVNFEYALLCTNKLTTNGNIIPELFLIRKVQWHRIILEMIQLVESLLWVISYTVHSIQYFITLSYLPISYIHKRTWKTLCQTLVIYKLLITTMNMYALVLPSCNDKHPCVCLFGQMELGQFRLK